MYMWLKLQSSSTHRNLINLLQSIRFWINLSLLKCNHPSFMPSYCVFPADTMMRHLLAAPSSCYSVFFSKTLLSLWCTKTPKGGKTGIWLSLVLNKQLLSGCTAVLRGTPTGKSPRRCKEGGRMDEELWEGGNGAYTIGEVKRWSLR